MRLVQKLQDSMYLLIVRLVRIILRQLVNYILLFSVHNCKRDIYVYVVYVWFEDQTYTVNLS